LHSRSETVRALNVKLRNGIVLFSNISGLFFFGYRGKEMAKNKKVQGNLKAMRLPLDLLSGCFFPRGKLPSRKFREQARIWSWSGLETPETSGEMEILRRDMKKINFWENKARPETSHFSSLKSDSESFFYVDFKSASSFSLSV
jgi:hypothetical protein